MSVCIVLEFVVHVTLNVLLFTYLLWMLCRHHVAYIPHASSCIHDSCMHVGCTYKILICTSRHKARIPIPRFLFPGGEIRRVCLSAFSQEGGLGFSIEGYGGDGVGTVQWCLQAGCVRWGFEEGSSHFWLSYAYIAPACPVAMFLLTQKKTKNSHTHNKGEWLEHMCAHKQSRCVLAAFDVC